MNLTPAQKQTLKADIIANSDTNALYTVGNLQGLADLYNQPAVGPNNISWKTKVTITEIGNNFNATELAGMTALNNSRLQVIADYSPAGINPTLVDRRAFFDDIFSGAGGQITRAQLLVLWKRIMSRVEKLFSTGTGSDVSPATLVVEGLLSYTDLIGI